MTQSRGVPQGGHLSPIPFLMRLMNDVEVIIVFPLAHKLSLSADDAQIDMPIYNFHMCHLYTSTDTDIIFLQNYADRFSECRISNCIRLRTFLRLSIFSSSAPEAFITVYRFSIKLMRRLPLLY